MIDGPVDELAIVQHAVSAPEVFSDAEVAALLRINVRSLRASVKRGEKPAEFVVAGVKPRRFRAREVRAWLGLVGSAP